LAQLFKRKDDTPQRSLWQRIKDVALTDVAVIARGGVKDGSLVFGNVGDSRIYVMRGGALQQITDDDSWVSRVLPADAIGSEEASRHPMRHVLTKVVGLREDMEPSVGSSPFMKGDMLLLCSDGLHGVVNDQAIAALLGQSGSVEEIAGELVEKALNSGSTDNITAVVVRKL